MIITVLHHSSSLQRIPNNAMDTGRRSIKGKKSKPEILVRNVC
jgi:hypothetical protein